MLLQRVLAVTLLIGLCTATPRDLADDADKYLLPWNLRPEHYDLNLFTHIENFADGDNESFAFHGIVEITLGVFYGDVNEVVLHTYDDVTILSAVIVDLSEGGPLNYTIQIGSYDRETNKQTFPVNPALRNGDRYKLTLNYAGYNSNRLSGFYRSSFNDTNGNKKWLVTTQFESFGARQAFPSFDEPEYKATFKLTINYNETLAQQGYTAHFNTEIESEKISDGRHITVFKTTPRVVSTYLVAFILAPFSISPEPTYFNSSFNGEDGLKPVRTIGQSKYFSPRQDLLSQLTAPAALNAMTRLTNVGFGFDKLEQAAIPDFSAGAMENWGLVTYRETALFFNNETSTTAQKQSIMSTTTHELAHQWFGDLVTLHWWTDVWLNEGFATFFATHAADTFREPGIDTSTWDLVGKFITGTIQGGAFKTDANPNSRPLTAEAYDRDTIDDFFDGISYDKGGSVLRMWLHALGSDIFYRGLERYLKLQQQSLGTPEILLASFDGALDDTPASEQPLIPGAVADLFSGWHLQAGYPVVSVTRRGGVLSLSQERFLSNSGVSSYAWNVPITYSTDVEQNFNDTRPITYLQDVVSLLSFELNNPNATWVVLNNQATGFYRVNYDTENWNRLLAVVNNSDTSNLIHPYNRAQILDDAANLAASTNKNYLDYDIALQLLSSLRHERSLVVWDAALNVINRLRFLVSGDEETSFLFDEYLKTIVRPAFEDLSLHISESDAHTEKLLKVAVGKLACDLKIQSCRQQAKQLFETGAIHPDVRAIVMCEAVKNGDYRTWETFKYEALINDDLPTRYDMLSALACSEDTTLLKRVSEMIASEDEINDIDAEILANSLSLGSAKKAKLAYDAVTQRSWLHAKSADKIRSRMIQDVFAEDITPVNENLRQTLEHNRIWIDKKQPAILSWLKSNIAL